MRTAVRGTFLGLLAQGVQLAASLGALVLLARLLDARAFGLAAASLAVTGVLGACADLGMNVLVVQRDRLDQRAAARASAACGFVLLGFVWAAAPLLTLVARGADDLVPLLRAGALVLPLHALSSPARARLQRVLRFGALLAVDVAVALCIAATSVLLATRGLGAWAIVGGDLAGASVALVLCLVLAPKARDGDAFGGGEPPPLRDGARLVGARLADAGFVHGDALLVGALLGAPALGLYRFARQHSVALYGRLTAVVEQVALPLFSRADRAGQTGAYLRLTRSNALAVLPAAALLWLAAPALVGALYPGRWAPAVPALRALAVAVGAAGLNSHPGVLWLARGQTRLRLRWAVANLTALLALVPAGAALGGLPGVGWALALRSALAAAAAQCFTGVPHGAYVRALVPGAALAGTLALLARMLGWA